jgi:hypothetical protein
MKPRARRRHEMHTLRPIVVGVVVGTVMLLGGTARVMAAGQLITLLDEVTVPGDCQPVESPPVSTGNALQATLLGRAEGTGVQIQLIFTADAEQGGGPRLRSVGAACSLTEDGIDGCPGFVMTSSIGGPFMLVRIVNCTSPATATATVKAFLLK